MIRLTVVFLAVAVLAIGGVAYASGGNDGGSGARAWAQVNPNGGSPVLVQAKGFVSVSSPLTGTYCLRAAPWIDLVHTAPVSSQEVNFSTTLGLVTPRHVGAPNSACPVNELQIDTWDASQAASPTLVNTVGFDVFVP